MDKPSLRRALKAARAALPHARRHACARAVRAHALRAGLLRRHRRIGVYAAHGSELDLAPLIRLAQRLRCRLYLPVVPPRGRTLRFAPLTPHTRWRRNRFGIREPVPRRLLPACALDLLFVPLLGIDTRGVRLGMGGGFYDASLAPCRRGRPFRVGVAYACQQVARLPHAPWDVRMDAVIGETGFRVLRGCARAIRARSPR